MVVRGTGQTGSVPSTLPDGDPAPASGELPASALSGLGERPFGFYVHVPFCVTRCGYCDFNTYTAAELGPGASHRDYADTAIDEVRLARRVLGDAELPVETVFFGGGTPTLLPADDLARILRAIDEEFGLARGAEVTTEANPESVDPAYLERLREGGFNRVSFGMQSAREHVLKVLDRQHTPGRRGRPYRRPGRPVSTTSTSTSSTAPPERATTTGGRRWRRPSRPSPTTSRPTL